MQINHYERQLMYINAYVVIVLALTSGAALGVIGYLTIESYLNARYERLMEKRNQDMMALVDNTRVGPNPFES